VKNIWIIIALLLGAAVLTAVVLGIFFKLAGDIG
jgi:hypothetical protein